MGIYALILANLVTLALVSLVWSALPNIRTPRADAGKTAKRGTGGLLGRGKTGSLEVS